jgi:uncharacterized protein YcbK (DUF882 family)
MRCREQTIMTRRDALKRIVLGGIIPFLPRLAEAFPLERHCLRRISFYNTHTNESLTVNYIDKNGFFDPTALNQLNSLFRCHYNDEVHPIDPRLFVLLDAVRTRLGAPGRTYELISGYRSPEYNELLRSTSRKVAKNSYHLKGMAADVRLEGVDLSAIQKKARCLNMGGVGKYSQFVHLDVGSVRCW